MEIVTADLGGTHARFAIASIEGGRVLSLSDVFVTESQNHVSLRSAWAAFAAQIARPLPTFASFAVAGHVHGDVVKFSNNPWTIRPASIAEELGLEGIRLINDFGAVANAVAQLDNEHFKPVCGMEGPLPPHGVISIVGPGTGLGVSFLLRGTGGYHVVETEGGHVDFAPLDGFEDALLVRLRERYRRVSAERIVSGEGFANIYEAIANNHDDAIVYSDDKALWAAALTGSDRLAVVALDRFYLTLGAICGDIALAHGASALVIAGGIGARSADRLASSGFRGRFIAKGRFERRLDMMPVRVITHPQPGLFGAAAAFAQGMIASIDH